MGADWAWSLPLILLNVIVHVFGLTSIYDGFTVLLRKMGRRRTFMVRFAVAMNTAVFLIVALHGLEATTWALAYAVGSPAP